MKLLSSTLCITPSDQLLSGGPDSATALEHLAEISHQQDLLLADLLGSAGISRLGLARRELRFLDELSCEVTSREAARLAIALRMLAVRDALWLRIDAGEPASWTIHVLPLLVGPYRVAPLFLYAWSCWRAGDAPRAANVLEYALVIDPTYPAGRLLEGALAGGIDPHRVPPLRPPDLGISPESLVSCEMTR